MAIKPYLFLGLLTVSVAGGALTHTGYAHSHIQGLDPAADSAIILVQNNDQQGFWGRIFNRSDDRTKAQPLHLDGRASENRGNRAVTPHNYSEYTQRRAGSRGRPSGSLDDAAVRASYEEWNRISSARSAHLLEQKARVEAIMARRNAENARLMQASYRQKQQARGSHGAQPQRRMVYDPERVWTYNPNDRAREIEQNQNRSRIFNRRSEP